MIEQKEIKGMKKALLGLLAISFHPFGFDKKIRGQSLRRMFPEGRVSVHLQFADYDKNFDVICDVAIRFDQLENMINEDNVLLSDREKKGTYSLGAQLSSLQDGDELRWNVRCHEDVEVVASQVSKKVVDIAFPYFDKNSNYLAAYYLLRHDDRSAWRHSPIHGVRAKCALGLAKLIGLEREALEELAEKKRVFLVEREDFGLADFLSFAKRVMEEE